jgi:hypothetical protein
MRGKNSSTCNIFRVYGKLVFKKSRIKEDTYGEEGSDY